MNRYMIYTLKEILKKDSSPEIIGYIQEQMTSLIGYKLTKNGLFELSCTTHNFVNVDDKLNILGVIVVSCKSFLFGEKIFFIEILSSKDNDYLIEQPLILKTINYLYNLDNNSKIISFVDNERIQKESLVPFGFVNSQGIMVKL